MMKCFILVSYAGDFIASLFQSVLSKHAVSSFVMLLIKVDLYKWPAYSALNLLQCFDAVGWAAGRASGL